MDNNGAGDGGFSRERERSAGAGWVWGGGLKMSCWGCAGFSRPGYLPGFHFGTPFLSHNHLEGGGGGLCVSMERGFRWGGVFSLNVRTWKRRFRWAGRENI